LVKNHPGHCSRRSVLHSSIIAWQMDQVIDPIVLANYMQTSTKAHNSIISSRQTNSLSYCYIL
jgi:hypothetical protein